IFTAICGSKSRLQFSKCVVIETKVGSGKPFFEDGSAGEQRHRCPFCAVRWFQQYFCVALKKSTGDAPGDIFSEGDSAVIERDVNGSPVNRSFTNMVDARLVQTRIAQL